MTNVTGPIGKGGFFPFGIEGALAGAATCFYAFVGFDLVASTGNATAENDHRKPTYLVGEETKNPQRAIPISICLTLIVCTILYCAIATILTLMVSQKATHAGERHSNTHLFIFLQVPYFLIDPDAALPEAFRYCNLPAFKYAIGVGALSGTYPKCPSRTCRMHGSSGIFCSLIGSLLPLPRVLYAIASDGLIFRSIAWIHPRLQTPIVATVLGGVASGTPIEGMASDVDARV